MRRGGLLALLFSLGEWIDEKTRKPIPAENWANKELYYQDMMNGVSSKQRIKNVENGRYKITETKTYPEPHRDARTGKIVIENCKLYRDDLARHGAVQTQRWVEQGKYNLTPEELEIEKEKIRKNCN